MSSMYEKKPVIDTKGTGIGTKMVCVVAGIILTILGFIVFMNAEDVFEQRYNESEVEMMIRSFMFMIPTLIGLFVMILPAIWGGTYIQVFEDHIEGKGLVGDMVKNVKETFYLSYNQISNITTSKNIVIINAGGKTYKVMTDKDTAQKVFQYCNEKIRVIQ